MKNALVLLAFLSLLLAACSDFPTAATLNPLPDQTPTEADPVLRTTLEAANATQAAGTAIALDVQHYNAEATLAAAEIQAEQIRASQTAIVAATQYAVTQVSMQYTAQAAEVTRQAESTATERAWIAQGWTATADAANATSTAQVGQAIIEAQFTQTQQAANVIGTQVGATSTAAQGAMERQATLDTANVAAASTAVAAQAVQAEAAAERTRITNQFMAWFRFWFWPLLLILLAAMIYYGYMTWTRNRVIPRGPRGDAPVIVLDGELTNPDLMVYPKLSAQNQIPADIQAEQAGNMAKVAAVRALPDNDPAARRLVKNVAANAQPNGYYIVGQGDPASDRLLGQGDEDALDAQWKEADSE